MNEVSIFRRINKFSHFLFLSMLIIPIFINGQTFKTLEDIRIRDPFIVADEESKTYFMYAQTGTRLGEKDTINGVETYKSKDLKNWEGPYNVFTPEKNHWGKRMVWAPEVHQYKDKFYLFATFTGKDREDLKHHPPKQHQRGTQILVSNDPDGPFKSMVNKPTTPEDWMSLDGTLWVENSIPYMVFCHEWAQIIDGTMELVQLENDLSGAVGKPKTLFKASDANWVESLTEAEPEMNVHGYVTDGCYLYKTKTGNLIMIWSSFTKKGYAVGQVISESGSIKGPWKHLNKLLFEENGGHGMIFETFEGKLMLSLHQPNSGDKERAKLFQVVDNGNYLTIK